MDKIRTVLPEGSTQCRIRFSKRESHTPQISTLKETLGEESEGMVFLDPQGIPIKYDMLQIYKDAIASTACRIAVDVPGQTKHTWQKTGLLIDSDTFGDAWKRDICKGVDHILRTSYVTASDPHLDAKLWPHMHPYGTGSLLSEVGSGGTHRLVKNRLLCIQSCFRQNNLYAFWFLNRIITKELFFRNFMRRSRGNSTAGDANATDPITRLYGTVVPSDIPESTAWWRNQQKELFCLSDDAEGGLMQTMLTVTANDGSPELVGQCFL